MTGSDPKLSARELLEEAHPALIGLSHWIHANPEVGFEEDLAAGWVAEWLTTGGFEVETGAAGLPTAVIGRTGPGPFHVAICAEYDALPEIGHACGHNIIAAASVGAALALASVADDLGLRVTVLGTPAEETGGGKLRFIDAGVFDGVHAAMMVHPWPTDVATPNIIAVNQLEVTFTGREAHAAGFPELGRNAADALVIAQTAIGLLRQQLLPTDRVHGIVTRGGDAPNIIPAHTAAVYMVRAHDRARLDELAGLVTRCFEAGALATGTTASIVEGVMYADMVHDPDLAALYRHNAGLVGRVFDDTTSSPVSTDMGNVSHVVPSIHPMIGIDAGGAVNHQAAFAEACATPSADQAILDGAIAMAWTAIDAAQDEVLRGRLMGEALAREALEMATAAGALEQEAVMLADAADALAPIDPDTADELASAAVELDHQAHSLTETAVERLGEAVTVQEQALLDETSGDLASDAEDLGAESAGLSAASTELAEQATSNLYTAAAFEDDVAELELEAAALAGRNPARAAELTRAAAELDARALDLKDEAEIQAGDAADLAGTAVFLAATADELTDEADILASVEPESMVPSLEGATADLSEERWDLSSPVEASLDAVAYDSTMALDAAEKAAGLEAIADARVDQDTPTTGHPAEVAREATQDTKDQSVAEVANTAPGQVDSKSVAALGTDHADWEQQFLVISAHASWEDEYAQMLGGTNGATVQEQSAEMEVDRADAPHADVPSTDSPTEDPWYSGAPDIPIALVDDAPADGALETPVEGAIEAPPGDFEWIPAAGREE